MHTSAAAADPVPRSSPTRHPWRSFKNSQTLHATFPLLLGIPCTLLISLHNLTGHWHSSGPGLMIVILTLASSTMTIIWLPAVLCALLIGRRGPLWRRQLRAYRTGRLTRSVLILGAVMLTSLQKMEGSTTARARMNALDGLLNWLDNLMDTAKLEGFPVAFLTEDNG